MSNLAKRIITVACIFVIVCFVQGCKRKPPPTDTNSIPDSKTIEQGVSTVQEDLAKNPMTVFDPNDVDPNIVDPNLLAPEINFEMKQAGKTTGPDVP